MYFGIIAILVLLAIAWAVWYFVLGASVKAGAEADQSIAQTDPDAPGRAERPGLVIGQALRRDDPDIERVSEEPHQDPLHAMEEGASHAVCGEAVVAVDPVKGAERAWPPALGSACEKCLRKLAAEQGTTAST